MKVKTRPDLMSDQDVASIWLDVIRRGRKKITMGFVYREHKLLLQPEGDTSGSDTQQERR